MKKTLFILAILQLCISSVKAEPVSIEDAKAKALHFISQNNSRFKDTKLPELKCVASKKCAYSEQGVSPAYYIFNYADSTGFVIVSAESRTIDILAYSDHDYFHIEEIDKGAEVFLNQYEKDIEMVRANGLNVDQKKYANRRFNNISQGEVLLETACLNQNSGYWIDNYCPLRDGTRYAPAGCTATAAAIIMHYHQWPAQGKGSKSYTTKTHGLELSWDFGNDSYDWACIPKERESNTWSEAAKNEVPKILFACGMGCEMDYDFGGSGASVPSMLMSMIKNFSYSSGYTDYYNQQNPDMSEAWDACRRSIDNNMPVFVEGRGNRGGHAFVLDGYNDMYFHYNMGWGGNNNGWYANGSISYDNYSLYGFYTNICPQTGKILESETLSTGISYIINDGGLLTISGEGEVPDDFAKNYLNYGSTIIECVIEEGVTSLGKNALRECNFLRRITIPASMTTIMGNCLNWQKIDEIYVAAENPVYSSPKNLCLYNKETKTLLRHSSGKNGVYFPEGIKVIGNNAFYGNENLVSVEIPEGVETIEDYAFGYCFALTSLTLPTSLSSIGIGTFDYCTSLTNLTLPNNVTSIGSSAFRNCSSLAAVTLSNNLTSIGVAAFAKCTSLTAFTVSPDNPNYSTLNGVLFNKDQSHLVCCPAGKSGKYIIPNGVTSISSGGFYGCPLLTSIDLPNSLSSIGYSAFENCISLSSITIPNNVTYIGRFAFYGCSSLKSINLPNDLTSIEYRAFSDCTSLESIIIPNGVTKIDEHAFYYCM